MSPTQNKSDMLVELEAYLERKNWSEKVEASTTIVDFMSFVRSFSINHSKYPNFQQVGTAIYYSILAQSPGNQIHIVFDSYQEKSLKDATRQLRANLIMHISKIENHTPTPKQMDRFWSSSKNKEMFQR